MERIVLFLLALSLTACGGSTGPTAPSPAPSPAPSVAAPPPAAAPQGPSPSFALSVSHVTIALFRRDGSTFYQYYPSEFVVSETSGTSSASLRDISLRATAGYQEQDCSSIGRIAIAAGQTRDIAKPLGYCVPYIVTNFLVPEISLVATFEDEDGRTGSVQQSVNVATCTLGGGPGLVTCAP